MTTENKEITLREKEEIARDAAEPTRTGVYYTPAVDIFENEAAITVVADMPGVDKNELDIDLKDNILTITGQVRQPDERFQAVYREYGIGGYTRRFTLGNKVDQSKITATLKDGVLTLELPKAEAMRPRKIDILTN